MTQNKATDAARLLIGDIADELNEEARFIACRVINTFSSGGHAYADDNTLDHFAVAFVFELLGAKMSVVCKTEGVLALHETLKLALADIHDAEIGEVKPESKRFIRNTYVAEQARAAVLALITREAAFGDDVGFRYLCSQIATHPTTIRAAVGALIADGLIVEIADGIYELAAPDTTE